MVKILIPSRCFLSVDEKRRHHEALKKLSEKTFFRLDPQDFTVIMRGTEFAEERYSRSEEFWSKREKEE